MVATQAVIARFVIVHALQVMALQAIRIGNIVMLRNVGPAWCEGPHSDGTSGQN